MSHSSSAYLHSIRRGACYYLVIFSILFFGLWSYHAAVLAWVLKPFYDVFHTPLIALSISSAVWVPMQVCFSLSFLLSTPFLLYGIWRFIMPALYPHERQGLCQIMVCSVGLFAMGVMFAHTLLLPWLLLFLKQAVPSAVHVMPTLSHAALWCVQSALLAGWAFQVPLAMVILVTWGMVSEQSIVVIRPWVILASFVIGMILTPPDVLSQCLLAVPLCLLFECGVLLLRLRRAYQAHKASK